MSSIWGENIKYSIFGESHGEAIGIVIDGLPSGVDIDLHLIRKEMKRRAPGINEFSTTRKELDQFEILSGYFNGYTTGAPLSMIIYNKNQRSSDYERDKVFIRPSHVDYTAYLKYNGFNDYRGGGHFSGRLTAPLVFAGAIAKQIIEKKGIKVGSHIYSIGNILDKPFEELDLNEQIIDKLSNTQFPVIDRLKSENMKNLILNVKEDGDSIGGIVECVILNLPPGLGSPFFDSLESKLAHILFSIPAVKGVEFGAGFKISYMKGSEANDEFYIEDDKIKTVTNNNGGILGGISNGMPIIFRVAFKPTPSIAKTQNTVDINSKKNTTIEIQGRHDPCIVQRAIPVVEAVAAMVALDCLFDKNI